MEKFIGDAVMAVFGVPTVHEDDALRALRAAVAVRDALVALNADLERDYGVSLALRIGVNTGEVVAGTAERLVTGDAVNVAARLQQAAGPGEILVGERTRELTRDAIDAELLSPIALKGKAELLAPYRLTRVLEGAEAIERRLDAPLVGRRCELDAVRAAFDAAVAERRCRLVTVLGPPGIGKTRLGREATALLAGDATVLVGRCLPYGEGITYWPLREIFAAAGAEEELNAAIGADAPDDVFWAVRKALESRARERSLALIVEDIHWAEPTLLDLLEHLHDWTRDAPLLVLCLARPELPTARPAWPGDVLTLEPLSRSESEQLIESLLGETELDADTSARVRDVAEGNPLFVEQLLANLAEGAAADRVPATIQALLAARLDALPEDERVVLERAAVIGIEFEWDALARLAPDGRRPPGSVLSSLVRKELVRPHDAIPDMFTFRHILVRDAAYERLAKTARADLHERAAGWMDGRGEEFDEIVGYHLEQAYRCLVDLGPPDARARTIAERAAGLLGPAGRRAFMRGDMPGAATLIDRAARLWEPHDHLRLELVSLLGRALAERGEWADADRVMSEALEDARAAGARAAAALLEVELAYLRCHMDMTSSHGRLLAALEEPRRTFEELGDQAGLARVLIVVALISFWAGHAAEAMEQVEQAARVAREAGDRVQEEMALEFAVNFAVHGPLVVGDGIALVAAARERLSGSRAFEMVALAASSVLEAMRGQLDEARVLVARAGALARELGREYSYAVRVAHAAARIEFLAGDWAAGERELMPACLELERMGDLGHLSSLAPQLVDALYAQERFDDAWEWSEKAFAAAIEDDLDAQVATKRVRAKLLARRGDVEGALRIAQAGIDLAVRSDYLDETARAWADLAEVYRLAGRPEEAAAAVDEAIRIHERKGDVASVALLRRSVGERV